MKIRIFALTISLILLLTIPTVVIAQQSTILTYTGVISVPLGTTANVSARLTDANGSPLAGKTILFTLDGLPVVIGITNNDGIASSTIPIPLLMPIGYYPLEVSFHGDDACSPSYDKILFQVTASVIIHIITATAGEHGAIEPSGNV